jgi:hypothetical protein
VALDVVALNVVVVVKVIMSNHVKKRIWTLLGRKL